MALLHVKMDQIAEPSRKRLAVPIALYVSKIDQKFFRTRLPLVQVILNEIDAFNQNVTTDCNQFTHLPQIITETIC